MLVPRSDDLIKQVDCFGTLESLDPVEAKLVDDQQVGILVFSQTLRERFIRERGGKVGDELGGGSVDNAKAKGASLHPDGLDDVAFSDARLSDQDQVGAASDELTRGKLLDLNAVEGFTIEVPVEVLDQLSFGELGSSDTSFGRTFTALVGRGLR